MALHKTKRPVTIYLTPELHVELHVLAVRQGVSMGSVVEDMIRRLTATSSPSTTAAAPAPRR